MKQSVEPFTPETRGGSGFSYLHYIEPCAYYSTKDNGGKRLARITETNQHSKITISLK